MRTLVRLSSLLWVVAAGAQFIPNRYIVELSGEPVASRLALKNAGQTQSRRARVQAGQQAVRLALARNTTATVLDSVDTVANALIVEATPDQVPRIAAIPGVASVHPEREFKPLLDHAVVLHRVIDAWNRVGQSNAGAGIRIAIIDSGVETTHPGFQDSSLSVPDGFPKVNNDTDAAYTNAKVIVARSYAALFPKRDPDLSASDHVGHGTALAMCAAGVPHAAPLASIAGVAPRAWLGSYKVFGTPGVNDNAPESAILKAIDDAVADGMDIISLSLGSDLAPRLQDDIEVSALERASAAGVMVVVAAGNAGPGPMTVGSPATAPSAIAVGASRNERVFSTAAVLGGTAAYFSVPSSTRNNPDEVAAPAADVEALDQNGLACGTLPPGSLQGRVVLILRGVCTFEEKLNHVQTAGAVAALVYTDKDRPDPVGMSVGGATLPAQMVSYQDGIDIKTRLQAAGAPLNLSLRFTLQPMAADPHGLASFSAHGPGVDGSIKPDLVAVGASVYTAAQTLDGSGDMYSGNGYITVSGTSFSTPLVAGALAVLKAARPGLTPREYRSLLINTAAQLTPGADTDAQSAGAGLFDLDAALASTAAVYPAALSLGVAGRGGQPAQTLTIENLAATGESYSVAVNPRAGDAAVPQLSTNSLDVNASGTAQLRVDLGNSLAPGSYQGFLVLRGAQSATTLRVPYWFAVPTAASRIAVLSLPASARAGAVSARAVLFRVLDASGLPLTGVDPVVTISEGAAVRAVTLREDIAAGAYAVDVRWSDAAGDNTITIQQGNARAELTVRVR